MLLPTQEAKGRMQDIVKRHQTSSPLRPAWVNENGIHVYIYMNSELPS